MLPGMWHMALITAEKVIIICCLQESVMHHMVRVGDFTYQGGAASLEQFVMFLAFGIRIDELHMSSSQKELPQLGCFMVHC